MSTTYQPLSGRYNGIATERYPESISSSLSSKSDGINPPAKHAKEYTDKRNTNSFLILKGYGNTVCSGLGVPLGRTLMMR